VAKTIDDIIIDLEQIDSFMYAFEGMLLEADGNNAALIRAQNMFYILWKQLQQSKNDALEVNGHIKVCNAVYAVNRVKDLKEELAELRETNQGLLAHIWRTNL